MPRLKFLRGARRDLHNAFHWYRERGEELATDFTNEVDAGLIQIRSDAASGHIFDETHRYVLLKRFPYAIYFRIASSLVTIVAVSHTAREPGHWQERE